MKKRRRFVRNNHKKKLIFSIAFSLLLLLGIGYSTLTSNLSIIGDLDIEKYVHVSPVGTKPLPVLKKTMEEDFSAFRSEKYRDFIKTITFGNEVDAPEGYVDSWDIGNNQNGDVMAYVVPNKEDESRYDLYIQGDGKLYANEDSSYFFANLKGVDAIHNINLLDTSKVTDMSYLFFNTGYDSLLFTLDLGNDFDTHLVTNMSHMFDSTGYSSPHFLLSLGSLFDTSKVSDMDSMFYHTGYSSSLFTLDLGKKFDTSSVLNMTHMFDGVGHSSTSFELLLGDTFNTRQVVDMSYLFSEVGYSNDKFVLSLGNLFDTDTVIDMNHMFQYIGNNNPDFSLYIYTFDFSKVTSYYKIFDGFSDTQKIYVKDSEIQEWILTNIDNENLTEKNVIVYEVEE